MCMASKQQMAKVVQFADDVSSFSSQYGSEMGMSYTVSNLVKSTTIYPSYGDYTQACVFRTYGPWWKICPSAGKPIGRRHEKFVSQDFVELSYKDAVIPESVDIFETYNPGTVVKILACDNKSGTDVDSGAVRWVTLWEGAPQKPEASSKITSPALKKVDFYTDLIRVEFCHDLCPYYTELDAVRLTGRHAAADRTTHQGDEDGVLSEFSTRVRIQDSSGDVNCGDGRSEVTTDNNVLSADGGYFSMLPIFTQNYLDQSENRSDSILFFRRSILTVGSNGLCPIQEHSPNVRLMVCQMQEEVTQLILSYLDTVSLCCLAQTCKSLRTHCYDPMQFTELNLQPFWGQVTDCLVVLGTVSNLRFLFLRGTMALNTNEAYTHRATIYGLLTVCGRVLTCLRLANCGFVNSSLLVRLSNTCTALQELDLQSCQEPGSSGLSSLAKLSSLRRLHLYRTQVEAGDVRNIVRGCHQLEHLNLGACIRLSEHDTLLQEIATNCRGLKSLDLWRWKSVTEVGLTALAENCPHLEEIDLGWISSLRSSTGCYRVLPKHCPKLRKLFFTANRSICDNDLDLIAERCPDLEQLDILGTREVSLASAERVLDCCKRLQFFDVSFCHHIDQKDVRAWRERYPHVNIKQSYQN